MSRFRIKHAVLCVLIVAGVIFILVTTEMRFKYHDARSAIRKYQKLKNHATITIASKELHDATTVGEISSNTVLQNREILNVAENCDNKRKKAVIIHAQARTGSTFLGEFFNQHPEIYYLFEPLHDGRHDFGEGYLTHQTIMKDLFLCDYSRIPALFKETMCRITSCHDSWIHYLVRMSRLCKGKHPYCGVTKLDHHELENFCRQSLFTAIKVIRLSSLSALVPLLADTRLDLKVIQLVRDPRAVVPSQLEMGMQFKNLNTGEVAKRLCSRYHYDWLYHQYCILGRNVRGAFPIEPMYCNETTRKLWKGKFIRLSHEFVSEDPMRTMKIIYNFTGLNIDENVVHWIRINTNDGNENKKTGGKYGFIGTTRNSSAMVHKWRLQRTLSNVRYIQKMCSEAMHELGYIQVETLASLTNISNKLYLNEKSTTF